MSSSATPSTDTAPTDESSPRKAGLISDVVALVLMPAYIGVCLAGFMVSAVINGLRRQPSDAVSADEVPV